MVRMKELPCDQAGYVCIRTEVQDTGIGINAEFFPHLFDAFAREEGVARGMAGGTGLGMSIVESLVSLMGGTIEVCSELGKGTLFAVTLLHKKAEKESYEKAPVVKEKEKEVVFSGKRILMAEDNDLNAEIATIILEKMGFVVDRVVDGVECLNAIQQQNPGTYDLILMDVQMPKMNGYKAAMEIRRLSDLQKARIPIIAITADAFDTDRQKALSAGMDAHIAKPIDAIKMKNTLAEIFC